jgi:5-methyltetrahydropteroyltriglutamate--homocysteine methyltransferase
VPDGLDLEAHGLSRGLYTPYMPVESDGEEHSDEERQTGLQWVCNGPIEYVGTDVDEDIDNLKAALEDVDVVDSFIPCVAPASVYWFKNEYYGTDEEFVYALADALKVEYRKIYEAGIQVSVDDAVLWHMYGTIRLRGGTPEDYRRWAQLRVDALNHALEGIPPERVRYHICSGSDHAAHTQDPLLRDVIDMVLQVNAKYLQIEQANARHEHEWRIWEDVKLPDDKVLVPGVVTHQTMMVEHPELVAQRLVRLAKLVGRERVMAGTDCGFAQTASTRRVPEFTQWAKLQALAEGAELATRELWPSPVAA